MRDDTAINDFLLGVIASEGCFYVSVSERGDYKTGIRAHAGFTLNMAVRDAWLVREVYDILAVGSCRDVQFDKEAVSDQTRLHIQAIDDLLEFRDAIDESFDSAHPFTNTSKYRAYEIWSDVLDIIAAGNHTERDKIVEILDKRDNMPNTGGSRLSRDEVKTTMDKKEEEDRRPDSKVKEVVDDIITPPTMGEE